MPLPSSPLVLCVLDGWGHRSATADNAISQAHTPVWDHIMETWPHTLLQASEEYVGLPGGQMGNSEVGHMHLGAGRLVMQDLPRIDHACKSGELASHPLLQRLIRDLQANKKSCHVIGLLSPGGVHSHQEHFLKVVEILANAGIPVKIHAFLDGRDTPPQSALGYVSAFMQQCISLSNVRVATISGRYYAMDRDQRWERTELPYNAIVIGNGPRAEDPITAIKNSYTQNVSDEFVIPTIIGDYAGIQDQDALIMVNFRADRARQTLTAIVDPNFINFKRARQVTLSHRLGMTEYSTHLNTFLETLFPPTSLDHVLGEVIAQQGGAQLRIAETEKYAHVTFFFNGGREEPFKNEDRILVPSPKVATYDLQPEMSAYEVTDKLIEALKSKPYDFVLVNYANTDMVGHTGNMEAAKKAVETVDACVGRLEKALLDLNGTLIITADHGNVEMMVDPHTKDMHTAHTCEPVPFVLINKILQGCALKEGGTLADVAPTILDIMNITPPQEMMGRSLLKPK